jgi:hypothetical protein
VVHCEVLGIVPLELLEISLRGGPIDTIVRFTREGRGGKSMRLMRPERRARVLARLAALR